MDRLASMAVLLEVVEAGSLSGAGRRLGMPLATVSRRIAELEAHLGTRLLTRSTRQLSLTEAGGAYVAACRRILDELGEAERAAGGEYSAPKGDLIVTAPVAFGRLHLLPVITDLLAAYPQIDVRLVLADRLLHLLDDHVDLAVRIGTLADSAMVAVRVGEVRMVTCASPAYLVAHGVPLAPADLAGHDCVTFDSLGTAGQWQFGALAVPIRPRLAVSTAESAVDAASAGLGVTRVLSYQAADAIGAGRLTLVLEDFAPPPMPVSLVHARQGLLPQKLRALLDFAAPRLRARLAAVAFSA